jgi:hypothetical protein
MAYLAAGVTAVASLGALAARSIGGSAEAPAIPEPAPAAAPGAATLPPPLPNPEPNVLSEADLMAVTPGTDEVSAAARAEWFVTDFFSTSGDPGAQRHVLDALPDGSRLPAASETGLSSYVEWVAASHVENLGGRRFRSTVLFRVLVSNGESGYVRLPVQAVDVVVEVGAAGGTRVVDLPMPVVVPVGPPISAWGDAVGEIPDPVRAGALRIAGSWGTEAAVVEGSERNGGWRIVVVVADRAGVRWPLSLWLTELGEPA